MDFTNLGGYILLVLLAILAPSPIPIPLDGIIIGLIALGFNPLVVLFTAAIGDIIGTILIYFLGKQGRSIFDKYRDKNKKLDQTLAGKIFARFGKYALLLSGVPFLGDTLILVTGFFKMETKKFLLWFIIGKALWYVLLFALSLLTKWSILR